MGLVAALTLAAIAWWRGARPEGFYDAGVYAMTARSHRRFTVVSLAFALFFAIALELRLDGAGIGGFAIYAIVAAWYGASFLRGASNDDE